MGLGKAQPFRCTVRTPPLQGLLCGTPAAIGVTRLMCRDAADGRNRAPADYADISGGVFSGFGLATTGLPVGYAMTGASDVNNDGFHRSYR